MGEARKRKINGEYTSFKGNGYKEHQGVGYNILGFKSSNIKKKNLWRRYLKKEPPSNPEERANDKNGGNNDENNI